MKIISQYHNEGNADQKNAANHNPHPQFGAIRLLLLQLESIHDDLAVVLGFDLSIFNLLIQRHVLDRILIVLQKIPIYDIGNLIRSKP